MASAESTGSRARAHASAAMRAIGGCVFSPRMPAQAPRLRQHAPPDTAPFITGHSAADGRLRHEFAGEADEQTHVHARLDWVHPIDNDLDWAERKSTRL